MKAKLLKEQMGVPAGTELEVLETGRAWTLRAPSGAEIVVPACDVEMVPDTEPLSEPQVFEAEDFQPGLLDDDLPTGMPEGPVDPTDPGLLVNIFGGQPQPVESEGPIDPETDPLGGHPAPIEQTEPEAERTLLDDERDVDAFPSDEEPLANPSTDDDLDEPLPTPQDPCEGESCESCQ